MSIKDKIVKLMDTRDDNNVRLAVHLAIIKLPVPEAVDFIQKNNYKINLVYHRSQQQIKKLLKIGPYKYRFDGIKLSMTDVPDESLFYLGYEYL